MSQPVHPQQLSLFDVSTIHQPPDLRMIPKRRRARAAEILFEICLYVDDNGDPAHPKIKDIHEVLGGSYSTIRYTIADLTKHGFIHRESPRGPMHLTKSIETKIKLLDGTFAF